MAPSPPPLQPLEFERPLMAIEDKIAELLSSSEQMGVDFSDEVERLRHQAQEVKMRLYSNLTPVNRLQIARHPQRPNFLELARRLSPDVWIEMRGDRAGKDDRACLGGIIELSGRPVMLLGAQKGRGMKESLAHNFGMSNPEGYRKALRLFQHAEKFNMPVVTLIDTPGAYPGMEGEQRGIGQAIAFNIREMARLRTPIVSIVTGEASSGGALGMGVANRIYMLEHALYTVISPEGCASILWRSADYAAQAATALKICAHDLQGFGIVDGVIPEPLGGAHHNPDAMAERLATTIQAALEELGAMTPEQLIEDRYRKYRAIGAFESAGGAL
ncbi:MAG: acetyl-CoA carboxylase carboxyltransferase subunit alpha [Vampirovibrionales bacterium]|nr:acetyl-CoA carboxylase carboxyltransferase subunit alpha [Vampirovibrionales bacterium]